MDYLVSSLHWHILHNWDQQQEVEEQLAGLKEWILLQFPQKTHKTPKQTEDFLEKC